MLTINIVYSPQLLDHFQHPRNVGELADASADVEVQNPACGDILRLSVKLLDGRIAEVRYRAKGCVSAIACGSLLTEMLLGRTPAEARAISREELVTAIGGLPPASAHASHLALDALAAALKQLRSKKSE